MVFDQDTAQYHLFFPQAGGFLGTRLTLAMNPEGGQPQPKFSTGTFLNSSGAFLNGKLLFGTTGGVFEVLKVEELKDNSITPELTVTTPFLWHGSLEDMGKRNIEHNFADGW